MKKGIILSAVIVASVLSCSKPKTEDLTNYYFPFDELNNGKEYIYEVVTNNEISSFSIKLKSELVNGEKYLHTANYVNNNLVSDGKELITSNNSTLLEGKFYEPDENGSFVAMQSSIEEKENVVFAFSISAGDKYFLHVNNTSQLNKNSINYRRSRMFDSYSQVSFNGKMIDCIVIKSKEQFIYPDTKLELDVKEYFGKDIGLFKTVKEGPGVKIITTLKQIQ